MINKTILLFAYLGLIAINAQAQVHVGFIGGANFSTVYSDDPISTGVEGDTFSGFGLVLDIPISATLSVRAEPTYLTKGGTINVSDLGLLGQNIIEYNYLDIPLFVSYSFATPSLQPYVMAGTVLSYRVNSEDVRLIRPGEQFIVETEPLLKKFDIGAALGAGIRYPIGASSLFFQGRYTLGLYDIGHSAEVDVMTANGEFLSTELVDTDTIKNRSFLLSLGFTFPLGK